MYCYGYKSELNCSTHMREKKHTQADSLIERPFSQSRQMYQLVSVTREWELPWKQISKLAKKKSKEEEESTVLR